MRNSGTSCRPGSRAISPNAGTRGSRAVRFSPVSSSTTAVTGCPRPIRCVGETATAITSVRRGGEAGSRPRIGADEMERVVVEVTCRQQSRDNQTTDFSTGVWSTETRELVRSTVERIVIHHDGVELTLKSKEIDHAGTSINDDNQSKSPKTVRLALPPARPRARKEILVPGNCGTQPRRIDQALILALARARLWMGSLRQGEFVDTNEIAQRFGLGDARRPTSHADRQAAAARYPSILGRPARYLRIALTVKLAILPRLCAHAARDFGQIRTVTELMATRDGVVETTHSASSETQRLHHVRSMARNRGHL